MRVTTRSEREREREEKEKKQTESRRTNCSVCAEVWWGGNQGRARQRWKKSVYFPWWFDGRCKFTGAAPQRKVEMLPLPFHIYPSSTMSFGRGQEEGEERSQSAAFGSGSFCYPYALMHQRGKLLLLLLYPRRRPLPPQMLLYYVPLA